MEAISNIELFLLETIWGILVLGALGSIVGGLCVYLFKKLFKYLTDNKDNWFKSLIYRYFREANIGDKFRTLHAPNKESEYLAYCISKNIHYLLVSIAWLLSVTILVLILLFFGLGQPYPIIALLSLILILTHSWLKSTLFVVSLYNSNMYDVYKKIEETEPKKFKDWEKSNQLK